MAYRCIRDELCYTHAVGPGVPGPLPIVNGKVNAEMKDDRGLYYYPNPANKQVRTYVRRVEGAIWFRLWNAQDPDLWEAHGWIPWEAIQKAAALYEGKTFDPRQAYDIELAKALLEDAP